MEKPRSFSKPNISKEIANRFGRDNKSVKAEMRYTRQVQKFVQKIEQAHKDAATSTLVYR